MPRIIQLNPESISQIAAGEVIERPASVLKELLENSLDAESSHIIVKIIDKPSFSISVSDNGIGMDKEDILLCCIPHTTSKIQTFEDVYRLSSFGFRGEALSTIAAVSHLKISSCLRGTSMGLAFENGKVSPIVMPSGTKIEVSSLFYNIPARKKFLKSLVSEKTALLKVFEELSLAHPYISFELFYNERKIHHVSVTSRIERIYTMFSHRWLQNKSSFFQIDEKIGNVKLWVLASSPAHVNSTSKHLWLFVNHRAVVDKILSHAIKSAYQGASASGTWPYLVLFLELDSHEVDVNVHPSKREVRFVDPPFIHEWVVKCLKEGIQKFQNKSWRKVDGSCLPSPPISASARRPAGANWGAPSASHPSELFNFRDTSVRGRGDGAMSVIQSPLHPLWVNSESVFPPSVIAMDAAASRGNLNIDSSFVPEALPGMTVIGQIHKTYIVCDTKEGLMLVDQHAAHERIVFEKLIKQFQESKFSKQYLLIPVSFQLDDEEIYLLRHHEKTLDKCGIEFSILSAQKVAFKSLPLALSGASFETLFREILDEIIEKSDDIPFMIHKIFATLACHSSIRAGQSLAIPQMEELVENISKLEYKNCPHGRPVFFEMSYQEIEKRFKRI
ncbi:MAG: DNA mismatch repair endonuclease MutL [Deltaproteobacteria bacterium]|nr:DNA mismatch repair endonuclease MutL [Deltaproteobacteria bacterium]